MKYLCLIYGEEDKITAMDDEECIECDKEMRASGHCIASEALQPVATATTIATSALRPPTRPIFRPRTSHVFTLPRGSLLLPDRAMVRPDMR